MMYVQENEETMPGSTNFWGDIDIQGKITICPTAGKKISNAYAYNANIAGKGLGEIADPVEIALTADSEAAGNLMAIPGDITLRHTEKAIMSFVDGHVTLTTDTMAIVFFDDNSLLDGVTDTGGAQSLNQSGDVYVNQGNANTTTEALHADARFGYTNGTLITQVHNSFSTFYTLPVDKFKNSDGNAPTEWWGFSMGAFFDNRGSAHYDASARNAAVGTIDIMDGSAFPGKMLARVSVCLWGWGENGIRLYLGGTDAGITATSPVAEEFFMRTPARNAGNGLWDDIPGTAAAFAPIYNFVKTPQKFSFVIDKNGNATVSYGGRSISAKLDGVTFNDPAKPPRIRIASQEPHCLVGISNFAFGAK